MIWWKTQTKIVQERPGWHKCKTKDRILGKSTLALVAHLPAGNIPQPAASVSVTSKESSMHQMKCFFPNRKHWMQKWTEYSHIYECSSSFERESSGKCKYVGRWVFRRLVYLDAKCGDDPFKNFGQGGCYEHHQAIHDSKTHEDIDHKIHKVGEWWMKSNEEVWDWRAHKCQHQ